VLNLRIWGSEVRILSGAPFSSRAKRGEENGAGKPAARQRL
jgi:hypothetical protein